MVFCVELSANCEKGSRDFLRWSDNWVSGWGKRVSQGRV
jgi:hypothetical protein